MEDKRRSILIIGIIVALSVFNLLTPVKAFSNKENRYLEQVPEISYKDIISGDFTDRFQKFTTDQFILRDKWTALKTISDLAIQKKDNNRIYFGKEGYLFEIKEDIDWEQFNKNMESIDLFLEKTYSENENTRVTALLVPTKGTVLKDKLPDYAPTIDEKDLLEKIKSSLSKEINIIDLIEVFEGNSDEYIYYKTDHHWTSEGAYYGYKYFLSEIGKEAFLEKDFKINEVSDDFLGTLYRKANFYMDYPDEIYNYIPKNDIDYNILINKKDRIDSFYDESYLNKTDKYSYFLGGDNSLIEIKTSIKNDKTILIIKDSFANSFIPFIANHYENLIIIDTRYFAMSISEYINDKNIDDLLFLFNIENFAQEKSFTGFRR